MSAASGESAVAPSLRRLPFTVNVAPAFANPFLDAPLQFDERGGLVFGIRESGSVLVKRSYPFDLRAPNKGDQRWFEAGVMAAQLETDFKSLTPVGWYILRSTGGLLESDIELHNRHFPRATDLAIVLRPEGGNEIVCEIYSRSIEGLLSEEGHRWGMLRLTRQKLLEAPAEVTMRAQMRDDFFMRAYNEPYEESGEAEPAIWRRALDRLRRGPKDVPAPEKKPQPAYDPSEDVTRVMPRELALKALGLDVNVEAPPAKAAQTEEKSRASVPLALQTPEKDVAQQRDLPRITAEPPRRSTASRAPLWISAAIIFAIAAAGTFAVIHYRVLPNTFVSTTGASSPLGLKLEGQGDRILVTWNRKGDAALRAVSAQLEIHDGTQHKTLALDTTQILTGSVLYRPNSADVTFRLQMTDGGGKQLDETLRVLDASRTNNDGIKAIGVDGTANPPPASMPKRVAPRKTAEPIAQENAVAGTDASRDVTIRSELPSTSDLPLETQKKEALPAVESEKPSSPPETESPSETVLAPAPVSEKASQTETPGAVSANPLRNYIAPKPIRQVMPNLRAMPQAMATANAQVEVTVSIDGQGRVLSARVTNTTGRASSGLANAAVMAARGWIFSPATMNGQAVASEHAIVFNFKPASR